MALLDEWIDKAETDYQAAIDLHRRRSVPLPEAVCHHCQQSAEKYLKAYLVMQGSNPPRTHDLISLSSQCSAHETNLARLMPLLLPLNRFGVEIRYPGAIATVDEAKSAGSSLRSIRKTLRGALRL